MKNRFLNSKGEVFYGVHFYPGVAEYRDSPKSEPYRVFVNEDTIRKMSQTFPGRPVFVQHVGEVDSDLATLRNEADGWVVRSFYNPADGKTWAQFVVVSDEGLRAVKRGGRLSNAYVPKSFGPGGLWNGVAYAKEVSDGEFEHLAIVEDPRYEDCPPIMNADEFKKYNDDKELELRRIANSKEEKAPMKISFFKRTKVENESDLAQMEVILPKSGKSVAISKLVNDMDDMAMNEGKEQMAHPEHMVNVGDKKMSVGDMCNAYMKMNDELDLLREKKPADKDGAKQPDIASMDNDEDDEAAREKAIELAKHEEKEIEEDKGSEKKENADEDKAEKKEEAPKGEKKQNAATAAPEKKPAKKEPSDHFKQLKNAADEARAPEAPTIMLSGDRVELGRTRYGS